MHWTVCNIKETEQITWLRIRLAIQKHWMNKQYRIWCLLYVSVLSMRRCKWINHKVCDLVCYFQSCHNTRYVVHLLSTCRICQCSLLSIVRDFLTRLWSDYNYFGHSFAKSSTDFHTRVVKGLTWLEKCFENVHNERDRKHCMYDAVLEYGGKYGGAWNPVVSRRTCIPCSSLPWWWRHFVSVISQPIWGAFTTLIMIQRLLQGQNCMCWRTLLHASAQWTSFQFNFVCIPGRKRSWNWCDFDWLQYIIHD